MAHQPETSVYDKLSADQVEFIEAMGIVTQGEGMPRIAGRLLGLFVVYDEALSFGELAETLQVSRASVSTNTRMLEEVGVIERVGVPGERQDHFRLTRQPYSRLVERQVERHRRARSLLDEKASALQDPEVRERARHIVDHYGRQVEQGEKILARLAQTGSPSRG